VTHTRSLWKIEDLRPGDHVCHIYHTEEQQHSVLSGFVGQGLQRGEKVIHVGPVHAFESLQASLERSGIEAASRVARGQLTTFHPPSNTLLEANRTAPLLYAEVERALAEEYTALRVAIERFPTPSASGVRDPLLEGEVQLQSFCHGSTCSVLCQYDRRGIAPAVLMDVLRIHPVAIIGTEVYENFYYTPPAGPSPGEDEEAVLNQCLENLARHGRVEKTLRQRNRELELLDRASRALVSTLNLDQVLATVLEEVRRMLDVVAASVWLIDPDTGAVVCRQASGPQSEIVRGWRMEPGEGIAGWVARSGRSLLVPDTQADARHFKEVGRRIEVDIRSILSTPLRVKQQVIGALQVVDTEVNRFRPGDLRLIEPLAATAAIAVENARLYAEADRLRAFHENIVQSMEEGILLEDAEGRIRFINPKTAELLGYTLEELAGQHWTVVIAPERLAEAKAESAKRLEGVTSQYESVLLTRDGERVPALISARPLFEGKEYGGVLAVFTDISERKRREEEQQQLQDRVQAQQETLIRLTTHPAVIEGRLDQALPTIAQEVAETLEVERVGIWRFTQAGSHIRCLEDFERSAGVHSVGAIFPTQNYPHYFAALEKGLVVDVSDVKSDPRTEELIDDYWEPEGIGATLEAPIRLGGQLVGVVCHEHTGSPRDWTPDEVAFASQVAELVSQTFLNAKLRNRTERLVVVNRIARAAGATLHLNNLMETVYHEITSVFQADGFLLALYDAESDELDFRLRVIEGARRPPAREPLGNRLTSLIVREKKALLIYDLEQEREFLSLLPMWDASPSPCSWLGVPLQIGERVIGVIGVQSSSPHAFGEEEQLLLSTIADQVAVAVENARLFEAEYSQRELAQALQEAATVVSSTLDLEQVLDRILEQVERVVPGDTFNVMLLEGKVAQRVRGRGYEQLGLDASAFGEEIEIDRYPALLRMREMGEPVVIPDTAAEAHHIPHAEGAAQRSYVAAPIDVAGVTVGFLNVAGSRAGQFGPDDALRLEAFAHHAAIAIHNARLYRQLQNYAELLEKRVQERTAQLECQYAQLDAVLRSASDGIIVTDAAGEILQTNPVAEVWLTRTLVPEDARQLRDAVRDLARRAAQRPAEMLELKGMDLELKAAPISEPGVVEEATAVVAVYDASHLKALDRMKTRFVSNVSHELRTPITTIKLYADLMMRRPEKWREYAGELKREADRQAKLIEDILQLSHIDAWTGVKARSIPLDTLIGLCVDGYQMLARERRVEFVHHPAETSPVVLVDPDRISQVLDNLVVNALRYTSEGGRVTITSSVDEAHGRRWGTMTIRDTGIGIPPDELDHIFERFYRGQAVREMQIPGTGLGLAIVKEIVELHGGRVTVESQVGDGSTFTVWLPLAE
jgi:PAS domain S-box-containing protein